LTAAINNLTASTEQWVTSGDNKLWKSSGGASAILSDNQMLIKGKTGDTFTSDDAVSFVSSKLATGDAYGVYVEALRQGISANSLDALMGWSAGTSNAWAIENNLPAFAAGGYHSGGIRLVGEHGPELEVTGPSRIFNANQTRDMLSGGSSDVADRLETMSYELRAIAIHTSKTARILEDVTPNRTSVSTS
jgi:hypothetical protein